MLVVHTKEWISSRQLMPRLKSVCWAKNGVWWDQLRLWSTFASKTSTKEHHPSKNDNHRVYPEMIRYNETSHRLELRSPETNDKIQWNRMQIGNVFARGPMVGEIGRSEIRLRAFSWDSKEMERCTMKQNADSEWVCREVKCYCCERAGRSD
jgi:hypothetical protein